MSDQQPSMDEILASIRARVSGPADAPPEPAAAVTIGELVEAPTPAPPPVAAGQGGITLESLVAGLLEPMLKAWLDANLPEIVDRAAQAEIRRVTGRG